MSGSKGAPVRTVQRWRKLGIGPPFVMVGATPYYPHTGETEWLAAGGTRGAEIKKQHRKRRR